VPDYRVTKTSTGLVADYISTVSNYPHEHKHLNPPGFLWRRRFEVFLPFTAKLTVFFPKNGQLHIFKFIPTRTTTTHYAGFGPATVEMFRDLWRKKVAPEVEVRKPQQPAEQGQLFK